MEGHALGLLTRDQGLRSEEEGSNQCGCARVPALRFVID